MFYFLYHNAEKEELFVGIDSFIDPTKSSFGHSLDRPVASAFFAGMFGSQRPAIDLVQPSFLALDNLHAGFMATVQELVF